MKKEKYAINNSVKEYFIEFLNEDGKLCRITNFKTTCIEDALTEMKKMDDCLGLGKFKELTFIQNETYNDFRLKNRRTK